MKTSVLLSIILSLVICSCSSEVKTNTKKVTFGIHEVVTPGEIPATILDSLMKMNVHPEENAEIAFIGYIKEADSSILNMDFSQENFKLAESLYTVDTNKEYYAIAAIKPVPSINNTDIKKSKSENNSVIIYLNMAGARKLAELTKNDIGKSIAVIIDNKIYTIPKIQGEIREGVVKISGLKSEADAKNISASLNASVPE